MGDEERKNICRCNVCKKIFEFNNCKSITVNKITRNVCPECGSLSFSFIQLNNKNDERFLERVEERSYVRMYRYK